MKYNKIQDLKNFSLPSNFRGKGKITVQLWWLVSSTLFSWSPQFMYSFRVSLLRMFGAKIGSNVLIRPTVIITYPWKLVIGSNSWIGDNVKIYNLGNIIIGNDVVVSQESYLCTGSHNYRKSTFDIWQKEIVINDESWIGTDVFIYPGIIVGKGVVVAARSTVTENLIDNNIYAGTPAKLLKKRLDS